MIEGVNLDMKLITGKHFNTDIGERKRKFFVAVNNVMYNGCFMCEDCFIEILCKQCMPILMHASGVRSLSAKKTRRVSVCLNRSIRRVFNYRDLESVQDISYLIVVACKKKQR